MTTLNCINVYTFVSAYVLIFPILLLDHTYYTSSQDGRKFLEEALRMQEFDHPHILRLKGIALDKENMPLVVLPFMKHGDLLSYIRDELNVSTITALYRKHT